MKAVKAKQMILTVGMIMVQDSREGQLHCRQVLRGRNRSL